MDYNPLRPKLPIISKSFFFFLIFYKKPVEQKLDMYITIHNDTVKSPLAGKYIKRNFLQGQLPLYKADM